MATSDAVTTVSPSEFHYLNSKITPANSVYLGQSIAQFSQNREALQDSCYPYKTYPGAQRYSLKPQWLWRERLTSLLRKRRSSMHFQGKPISKGNLATLLLRGYGFTSTVCDERFPEIQHHLRAAPSGGALYPIEIYPLCVNIKNLPSGCYHYHAKDKVLENVETSIQGIGEMFIGVPCEKTAAILIFTAIRERTYIKYGERGYRFLFLEAGHIAQNILLLATALGIRACPIGGFMEDKIAKLLHLDHESEWVVYAMALGK
ncbi:SagB/ThcOx family dehydrogenase [Candidatus Uabimicrobium amorphum]|uniref:Nitroreductase domain-containing protein n=1 Tax=Uabimicrobium amorphum TaxID=2596890 RepID=A0A5S9IKH0_UABAM|nr:SagB/ThcOx family dehydrogenase [Candidatus Uabimicrobium amorphum]BBM83533.1 hypothetical protein UABAM_01885 [Candidatus Uabimicrobium amorphum]